MALREKRRLCKFVSEWTTRYEFSSWLVSVKEDKHKAYCLLCRKIFPVSHGGLHDVKTHAKSKRHICLQQQQENRAILSTGQVWPTQGVHQIDQILNPSNSKTCIEKSVTTEDLKEEPKEGKTAEVLKDRQYSDFDSESESGLPTEDSMHPIAMASPGTMETPQQYCLRWKYHHSNLQVMFSQLLERESFCDVTLACEGKMLRAHKMMLSACSTYFDSIFSQHEESNPIVILKDVKFADIKALVEFMYKGEINVENAHLSSLLKTAEELRIKGLAEVSWRSEGEGSWRSVEGGNSQREGWRGNESQQRENWRNMEERHRERLWSNTEIPNRESSSWRSLAEGGDDADSEPEPPPPKKMKPPPALLPHHPISSVPIPISVAEHFSPKVTSVTGSVGSKDEFTESAEPAPEPEVTMWEPESQNEEFEDDRETPPTPAGSFSAPPSNADDDKNSSFNESHMPDLSQYPDVMKMNDYLSSGGRRPQFWEEPFTRRVMEGIKNKEMEMKVAAELLGVSYGTLYGRYRDAYGCLKHPYRVRDFWLEQGPAEVLAKLQRKELTLFRAAEMLNVTVTTLANYLSTLRQGETASSGGEEDDEEDAETDRLASARQALSNNPDITIVKREREAPSLNGNK
uniref:BTB domain-containing protein n=1 Tax=Clastoptera arizonana TaxID=38151 RepID=A0A1B6DHS7_9HEMI